MMEFARTAGLFIVTAVAEIAGCCLPYLWLKYDKPAWLLLPAALSLAAFTSPLRSAGFWLMDRVVPTRWDLIGAVVAITGMAIIVLQPQQA